MSFVTPNLTEFGAIVPEILLTLLAFGVLALDLFTRRGMSRRTLGFVSAGGLIATLLISLPFMPAPDQGSFVLGGMVRYDTFSFVLAAIFILAGAFTALIMIDFKSARAGGEFYALLILAAMAMCLMAAAADMILLYLATEVVSIALYLLAGFMRDNRRSAEAGMKYFIFGAVTSGIMLYGLSLLFGASGSTSYVGAANALMNPQYRNIVAFALLLVTVGFLFKSSAVPFHFWAPDVYEGAPTPVSGFLSTASKAAGFAIMLRFLMYVFPPDSQSVVAPIWIYLMQPVAILTMFVGNLGAAVQTSVKRMLAYSSVAQAGYMFIGVAGLANIQRVNPDGSADALAAVIFYLAIYMIANVAGFAIIGVIAQRIGGEDYKDFAGLSRRSPYLALAMTAVMISLLGAPPMVGFAAKLYVFRAAMDVGLTMLVTLGVVNVLISVYFYLGVVKAMYVDRSPNESAPLRVPSATGWVIGACAIGSVLALIFMRPFYDIALAAAVSFLRIAN